MFLTHCLHYRCFLLICLLATGHLTFSDTIDLFVNMSVMLLSFYSYPWELCPHCQVITHKHIIEYWTVWLCYTATAMCCGGWLGAAALFHVPITFLEVRGRMLLWLLGTWQMILDLISQFITVAHHRPHCKHKPQHLAYNKDYLYDQSPKIHGVLIMSFVVL